MFITADGEYFCDEFLVRGVDFKYLIIVDDLEDQTTFREIAEKLKDSSRKSVEGWNLGDVNISFMSGKFCGWDEMQNTCSPIEPIIYPEPLGIR